MMCMRIAVDGRKGMQGGKGASLPSGIWHWKCTRGLTSGPLPPLGTAYREAAARSLRAEPVFGFFHRPSSTTRVMMRLAQSKPPSPREVESNYRHVARCSACGELWDVAPMLLGAASTQEAGCRCKCVDQPHKAKSRAHSTQGDGSPVVLGGPMWTGPMHDADFVKDMRVLADERGWTDVTTLLATFEAEAQADAKGALLFYHLGEVQTALAHHGMQQPPLEELLPVIRRAGFSACRSHVEPKALKTSASLSQIVELVKQQTKEFNSR